MPILSKFSQLQFNNANRIMAVMLLTLHAMLIWGDVSSLHKALFLSHYGCFLVWQPMMGQAKKISWQSGLLILAGATVGIFFVNWWLTAIWIASLFALIGGRIFSSPSDQARLPNVLASTYLLAILLLWVVPKLVNANDDLAAAEFLLIYVLPILPLTILFLARNNKFNLETVNIDFFYTLMLFLLTLITILGSFAIGIIWQIHYIKLLIYTVMCLALTLVILSWLWNPSATFSGLELLMSRYLLSVGQPFEQWVKKIAVHAEMESTAHGFLQAAMIELSALNWVSGLSWEVGNSKHQLGETTAFIATFSFQHLQLTLYSRWQFRPALYLHGQLLTQILGEFYEAKRREETISQNTYMQSFYETGSRLTHDIKNILQSLGNLTAAAEQPSDTESDAKLITLIKKQLPRLNQRLTTTLNKLEQPSLAKKRQSKVTTWWKNFRRINTHHLIRFETPENMPNTDIDPEVLDSVVDNLLQNALEKAKIETDISITVSIMPTQHFCLEVTDSGSRIPDNVAKLLFNSHINSENGLGVGLYHAAQQAFNAGYLLSLVDNQEGGVRFRLETSTAVAGK
jgi:signal transduction histidine kinase